MRGVTPLKLYIPDFVFVDGDILEIFWTNIRDNRIEKQPGTFPVKFLYGKMLKLRKMYKLMLEETFHRSMLDKIDPNILQAQSPMDEIILFMQTVDPPDQLLHITQDIFDRRTL